MALVKSVCVYCGSGIGSDPEFTMEATRFGIILAENKVRLVYGGGAEGLMGIIAKATLDAGGEVTGIIPDWLQTKEGRLPGIEEIIVQDMHQRKKEMFDRANAFVALPGGIGTLEELVEQMTWKQLGRHKKPIVLANIGGFWDPLVALLDHMSERKFINYPGKWVDLPVAHHVDTILPMIHHEINGNGMSNNGDAVPLSIM